MATQVAAGSAPGRASSPYGAYPPATPLAVRDRAKASSSQPTGWRGRRPASTAPTVAALTVATTGPTAVFRGSDRPARLSRPSSQKPAARPSTTSAHSAHATTPDHGRGWAGRAAGVTATLLAARSAPAPPPSQRRRSRASVAGLRLGNVTGRRACRNHQAFVNQAVTRLFLPQRACVPSLLVAAQTS